MTDPLLQAELIRDEALRQRMYVDTVGKHTIGVGHNLDAKPISQRAALVILEDDVADVLAELDAALPWWRELNEVRQRVLINMGFNLGVPGLLAFHNALSAAQAGNYVAAANEMLNSKWATQVGERAQRLAKMMATGEEPE